MTIDDAIELGVTEAIALPGDGGLRVALGILQRFDAEHVQRQAARAAIWAKLAPALAAAGATPRKPPSGPNVVPFRRR